MSRSTVPVEVPLDEARERWQTELEFLGAVRLMDSEEVRVYESLGRITSHPVTARFSSPHYYASAVTGLACRSTDTFAAAPERPVRLRLAENGFFVDTGSPLPEGCDAVIPIHELRLRSTDEVEIDRPSAPWRNVSPVGEDVRADEVILPRDHRIGPLELGAMLAGGIERVQVYRRPRVGLLPIGSNLVEPGQQPGVGQRIETNTPVLAALVEESGGEARRLPVVRETFEDVRAALLGAVAEHDAVIAVAGPSHRTALLARLLEECGERVLYGVALKPGHSVTLGVVEKTPVLGLPRYPFSSYVTFELFARPLLAQMTGQKPPARVTEEAVLATTVNSPAGVDEFLRVALGAVGGNRVAVPIPRGAELLMSMLRAEGLVLLPAETEGIARGERVRVTRLYPERSIFGNIVLLGTHDICFELLRKHLIQAYPDLRLVSANTGSREGLKGLEEGLCHLASLHLFDDATGEYNIPHLERSADPRAVVLVNLFRRHLGLLVARGNPKGIRGFEDLARDDVRFVNRQVGSGTRVLIDHYLRRHGILPEQVKGYAHEGHTHMSVAAAVASGTADVAVGIPAAGRALKLDFIPCIPERLDLAIPKRFFNLYPIQCLLEVIRSQAFRTEASSCFGGYDFSRSGELLWESP